ncbi:MAG: hypothetical protein AAB384_01480 [Patescibacteria group bacterium]
MGTRSFVLQGLRTAGVLLGAFALFVGVQADTHAATKTWDGSGNMSTASNWDSNTLPADGDTIVFDGTSTSNATWDSTFASSYSNLVVRVASGYSGIITLGANATIASSTISAGTFNVATYTLTAGGAMTIAGGTVTSTFNSGTAVFNDDLVLNSGTFLPALDTTVKGDWMINGGTLTLDEAHMFALEFGGTAASQTFRPGSSASYCTIEVNNTAGGSSDSVILVSDTLTSYCAATITQGLFDFQTNNIAWTQGGSLTIANNAQAGLALGTPTYTFQGNIQIGSSATLSTVSTTYSYDPQDSGTYYVTSTSNHVFAGTFQVTLPCASASTMIVSGGLATTHLKVTEGNADFRTKNATLDADGTLSLEASGAGLCNPGTHIGLLWGTGQFNVGGHFYQRLGAAAITAGENVFIFDGTGDQFVSSTVQFYDVYIRKESGTLYPGTSASGSLTNVMGYWDVINLTVATGTLRFDVFDDPMVVTNDFLVTGASTSIVLPNGTTGITFAGDVLMTAAGTITAGSATTSISTTQSGTLQSVGASAGTMNLGKIAVSSTMIIPAGYSLTVTRPSVTTTLAYIRVDGGTFTVASTDATKLIAVTNNQYRFASTSTVAFTGSGNLPSTFVYPGNVTISASGQTFTFTATTTVMGTLTIAAGTTVVVDTGVDLTVPAVGSIANSGTLTQTGTIINPNGYLRFVDGSGTQQSTITYRAGDLLYVEVNDDDGNLNGSTSESMTAGSNQIRLYSNTGDAESVLMTETGVATGIFRGALTVRGTNVASVGDGTLDMTGNGTLSVAFVDATNTTDASTTTISVLSQGSSGSTGATSATTVAGTVVINANAASTASRNVVLQLTATGASEMAVSEHPEFVGGVWEPYVTSRAFTLSAGNGSKTVYVKFASATGAVSAVASDSITVTAASESGVVTPPPVTGDKLPTTPVPGVQIPFGLSVGDLVKIDGNTAVYYIDASGTRRSFPMEAVYHSWYGKDFSKVKTITPEQLATFSLGKNMTIKPGTYLVKITTVPKVYAVTADATLQWVSTEARAVELYGADWAKKVVDVPDAYFVNYTILTTQL